MVYQSVQRKILVTEKNFANRRKFYWLKKIPRPEENSTDRRNSANKKRFYWLKKILGIGKE